MNKYFYIDKDNQQRGPISPEEFKQYGVTEETPVWCAGMAEWTKAKEIPELQEAFAAAAVPPTPPPHETAQPKPAPQPQKPGNFLVLAILSTIFCCLPFGVVGIVYASKVDSLWYAGKYDEAKEAAKKAKTWTWISIGTSIAAVLIYILCLAFFAFVGMSATNNIY